MKAWRFAIPLVAAGLCIVSPRRAMAQLRANGNPIRTSQYAIDLYQGTVLASTRVIGMGGAYVAIAEGVEGSFYNPAAPAVRVPWSRRNVDYDLGAGFTSPGTLQRSDFFNSGADRTNLATSNAGQLVFLDAEGHLQIDHWGFGAGISLQQYSLQRDTSATSDAKTDRLNADVYIGLVQVARSTANGQLILGLGLRPTALNVVNQNPSDNQPSLLFATEGLGYSAGLLWRPNDRPFRLGTSFNSAVTTAARSPASGIQRDLSGNRVISPGTPDEMYLPERVGLPWDLDMGVAVQFGARPFNPKWVGPNELLLPLRRRLEWRRLERARRRQRAISAANGDRSEIERIDRQHAEEEESALAKDAEELEREKFYVDQELRQRERKLGRWYILLSTSLRVSGAVASAVGVESFLQRVVDRSGRRPVASPHLGLESEVISNWLKLRAGVYGEPTRFDNSRSAPRLHTTDAHAQIITMISDEIEQFG
ncbi:MAG TPA: hypothetical protein VIV60_09680, partial [Polyangiaceae bacterium]